MKRRESFWAVASLLSYAVVPRVAIAAQSFVDVATKAPGFRTLDANGQIRTLEDFKGKVVVLEWTSPSCPFVRAQYASGKMQELQSWSKASGVVWLSVLSTNPARGDYLKPQQALAFLEGRKAQPTALLMDPSGQVGHAYGARNTPHMFVINQVGVVAYAGAIDTQPTVDESVVPKSRNLVRAALEDILAGRRVTTPATAPYGCLVGYDA